MSSIKHQIIEKRKYTRFPAVNECILILNGAQHYGVIGNISLGGIYLKTIMPEINDNSLFNHCEVRMNVADTDIFIPCTISFIASESNTPPDGAGISFSVVDGKSLPLIADYLNKTQQSLEFYR